MKLSPAVDTDHKQICGR